MRISFSNLAIPLIALGSVMSAQTNGPIPCPFAPGATYDVKAFARRLGVADMNGDGKLDLAVAHYAEFSTSLLGNGDGTFQQDISFHAPGVGSDISIADFDGD